MAYILNMVKLRGARNKIIWPVIYGGQAKVVIGARNRRTFMVENQFQTHTFSVFYERCLQFQKI